MISDVLIAISSLAGFYLLLSKREIDTVKNPCRRSDIPSVYLNSYLATLNAREWLREKIEEPVSIDISAPSRFTSTVAEHS